MKTLSIILGSIALLLIVAVVVSFTINFIGRPWSDSVEHWGQTGDFFGGTLNPILTLVSILITFYIAKEVHQVNVRQMHQQKTAVKQHLQFEILKSFNMKLTEYLTSALFSDHRTRDAEVAIFRARGVIYEFESSFSSLFKCDYSKEKKDLIHVFGEWVKDPSSKGFYSRAVLAHSALARIFYNEILEE